MGVQTFVQSVHIFKLVFSVETLINDEIRGLGEQNHDKREKNHVYNFYLVYVTIEKVKEQ